MTSRTHSRPDCDSSIQVPRSQFLLEKSAMTDSVEEGQRIDGDIWFWEDVVHLGDIFTHLSAEKAAR